MTRQEIIMQISELKNKGLSFQAITDKFNREGIPTLTGKGQWNKGTLCKLAKSRQDAPVSETPKPKTVKRHPDAEPKVMDDKALQELSEAKKALSDLQTAYDAVLRQNDTLNQKILNAETKYKGIYEGKNTELGNALNAALEEIETLKHKQTLIEVKSGKPENIDGWTVQNKKGYFNLFRRIEGKTYCLYLGKEKDIEKARRIIAKKEAELRGQVTTSDHVSPDIESRIAGAYLAASGKKWNVRVRLADLRKGLSDIPRTDVDTALGKMQIRQKLVMYRMTDPLEIRPEDEKAAWTQSGSQAQHIVYIENAPQ